MHETAALLVELGAVFLVLSVLGLLARRLHLSPVPLFLLAGLTLGEGSPIPLETSSVFVEAAAQIGLVLLLFALGLEFSTRELVASLRRHTPSGVVDFALNATPGLVAGLLAGLDWPAAVALAGVTWVSSSGIVARVIADLGRLGNRETSAVLSVLVLEDVAMAGYLPLLAVLLSGGALVAALAGSLLAVSLVVGVIVAVAKWGHRIDRVLATEDEEQLLLRVLGLVLLVAGVAELLEISGAIGAFLVGLAMTGQTARRVRAVMAPLRDLFAAAFFLAFGLQTAIGLVWPVLPVALALAAVTTLTKVVTGWYAAQRDGIAVRGRLRAGTALVARGEFSIVIAGLAVAEGRVEMGPLASAYVLVLAIGGPVLTRFADPIGRRLGRHAAVRE